MSRVPPRPAQRRKRKGAATDVAAGTAVVAGGCLLVLLIFALALSITTALVYFGWNAGLENAGIVDNEISLGTAVGLALLVNILRSIFRRPAPTTTVNN